MIQLFYQNINSLKNKLENFNINLKLADYDIIAITETWLNPSILTSEIFDDKYTVHRKDRNFTGTGKADGGGVLLAVKGLISERIEKFESTNPQVESIWIKIYTDKKSYFYLCVIYIAPSSGKEVYKDFFSKLEDHDSELNSCVLVVGDFNLPELSKHFLYNKPNILPPLEDYFHEKMNYFNLSQKNEVCNLNGYYLDLVLTDLPKCVVTASDFALLTPDPHHPCLTLEIPVFRATMGNIAVTESFHFQKADSVMLYHALAAIDWTYLYSMNDVNEALTYFYIILNAIFIQYVPIIKITHGNKDPIWYNKEIKTLIKAKERLRKKFKRSGLGSDYQKFSEKRAHLKKKLKTAYRAFCTKTENDINKDPQKFWNFISSKRKNDGNNVVLFYEDKALITDQEKTFAFAKYFASVYRKDDPNINLKDILKTETKGSVPDLLNIPCISDDDLLKAFRKLKPKFCKGIDGIPQYWVKGFSDVLFKPLLFIFNLSLNTEKFPDVWKIAAVSPLPKKPQTKLISEHRPISILCSFAKLFELILYQKIFSHMEPLFTEHQYGFLPKKSTATNLINFTEQVTRAIEDKAQLDVIYTDFRKAFDLVEFSVLLRKFKMYGFTNTLINFFHSYLIDRKQFITYKGKLSEQYKVNSSVCQGSCLGGLFFLVVINDLPAVVKHSTTYLFADDLKIAKKVKNINDCVMLQADLDAVTEWSVENKLDFNLEKCMCMSYTLKRTETLFNYSISNSVITRKTECLDLGVTFDQKLNFDIHIQKTLKKASRLLGFIKRMSVHFTRQSTITILYNAFVRSRLEYCCIVWNPIHATKIKLVEKPHRKFTKFLIIKTMPGFEGPYEGRLKKLNLPSLEQRRDFFHIVYLWKLLNNRENNVFLLGKIGLNAKIRINRSVQTFSIAGGRVNLTLHSAVNRMSSLANHHQQLDLFCHSQKTIRSLFFKN